MDRIKDYNGVQEIELFITTKVEYHQEWLAREVDKILQANSKTTIRLSVK
jgi:hypothetical protein